MTTFHMKAFLISFLIIPIFIVGQIIGISVAAIGEFLIRFFFGMFVYVETESENVIDLGNVFMSYFQNLLIFIMICVSVGYTSGRIAAFIMKKYFKKYISKSLLIVPSIYILYMAIFPFLPMPFELPLNGRLSHTVSHLLIICVFVFYIFEFDEI